MKRKGIFNIKEARRNIKKVAAFDVALDEREFQTGDRAASYDHKNVALSHRLPREPIVPFVPHVPREHGTEVAAARPRLADIPPGFLYPHQERARERFSGDSGLICFQMGTGKTMTLLAIIHETFRQNPDATAALVVGPGMVLDAIHSDLRNLRSVGVNMVMTVVGESTVQAIKRSHLVFCTYGKLARSWGMHIKNRHSSKSRLGGEVHEWLWGETHSICGMDEVHAICNDKTLNFKAAMELCCVQRIGLTGTPILNSAKDIISLRKWLRISEDVPVSDMLLTASMEDVESEMGITPVKVNRYSLTSDFETENERLVHNKILSTLADRLHIGVSTCDDGDFLFPDDISSAGFSGSASIINNAQSASNGSGALAALTHARQACLVPALVEQQHADEPWATTHSTKINMLIYYLKKYSGRVVIMTFFVSAFPFIQRRLEMEGLPRALEYHGSLSQSGREGVLASWRETTDDKSDGQDEPPRFLLATIGSAGVSLNLNADRLVLLEPLYNQQREKQAASRIIRMNGSREVTITSMLTTNSIEECIWFLAREKAEMADRIINSRGRLSAENINQFILRPLQKAPSSRSVGMYDQEECERKATSDLDARRDSIVEILGSEANPSERSIFLDGIMMERRKRLRAITRFNLGSHIYLRKRDGNNCGVVSFEDDNSLFDADRYTWSHRAYECSFLVFDSFGAATEALAEVIQPSSPRRWGDVFAIGDYLAGLLERYLVDGIWFTDRKNAVVFDPDKMLFRL